MKLQNIKEVSKGKVLDLMGLKVRHPVRTWLAASGMAGIGLLVGTGLTLLLAPKSGPQMRETIAGGFRTVRRRASVAAAVLPFVH